MENFKKDSKEDFEKNNQNSWQEETKNMLSKAIEEVKKIDNARAFIILVMGDDEDKEKGIVNGIRSVGGRLGDLVQLYNNINEKIRNASCKINLIEKLKGILDEK